jgi:lauroyl/myristoyl acyltransferase
VPIQVERLAGGRFRVIAHAPLRSADPGASATQQAESMMREFNRLLESWIVARPEAWQCLKRRWSKELVRRRLGQSGLVRTTLSVAGSGRG